MVRHSTFEYTLNLKKMKTKSNYGKRLMNSKIKVKKLNE